MKKGPQKHSAWAHWLCIPQEGNTAPSSSEAGSLLGTPLLYTPSILFPFCPSSAHIEGEPQTQALNIP